LVVEIDLAVTGRGARTEDVSIGNERDRLRALQAHSRLADVADRVARDLAQHGIAAAITGVDGVGPKSGDRREAKAAAAVTTERRERLRGITSA
jgi:hypothetical protein